MDTKGFSEMLVEAREKAGMTTHGLALEMKATYTMLQRMEKAVNNYNLKKLFAYLQAINCSMVLSNGKKFIRFNNESDCVEWLTNMRKKKFSQFACAELAKISPLTIRKIENRQVTARIDTFLKIIEAFNYRVVEIC